jgi:hypothetical protein
VRPGSRRAPPNRKSRRNWQAGADSGSMGRWLPKMSEDPQLDARNLILRIRSRSPTPAGCGERWSGLYDARDTVFRKQRQACVEAMRTVLIVGNTFDVRPILMVRDVRRQGLSDVPGVTESGCSAGRQDGRVRRDRTRKVQTTSSSSQYQDSPQPAASNNGSAGGPELNQQAASVLYSQY